MSTTSNEQGAVKKRNYTFPVILTLLIVGGAWFGISKYIHALHHEETDDAQVEANISPVIPRISGYVTEVRVKDNQMVKKGDTLLILDDRDMKLKLEQTIAALATSQSNLEAARATAGAAHANIATTQASVSTIDAQIETARVNVWRATEDFKRFENLIKDHSITQQQYEQALAGKQTAERQLQVLEQQKGQASHQVNAVSSQSNASASQIGIASAAIKEREVAVDDAKLNLSYTVVTASSDGKISKVNVREGQFVNAGAALFSIVQGEDVWVVANFKETQVGKIREGQKVIVAVDAFPDHEFEAKVGSFSPATGARFALLPPDNASGNFVKVVQRLPVRIEFTDTKDSLIHLLRAGLNADVDIHLDSN
ncbi:HlyD family secretion protein [Pseudobacter ginsenosidimutans]|uniref:Membrane fusion protein (Multidrug efflux system) n=1 Tax=Pseudobacter ginsenosidimutans TaxID=661488 RepID=A0A4Q7N382_9BACT|nr:HlyD family secretion protein [Pseudobacter ginsenosidimutans]QEC43570.1 HlyD family secretion protein [Pseudobacter ginsenosidimutans]RZS74965.1 membrane fusion protein (multidrug efflux system) [Pseudobacter ginsenosidimutans]